MVKWPWQKRKPLELIHLPHVKEQKGAISSSLQWSDKQPHPPLMSKYDELNNDPEVDVALDLLTDLIAGVGFHTQMPENEKPDHPNKKVIDEYCERINADEKFRQITRIMLGKGFCPVEILTDYNLKILPSETFYIWRTIKGEVYRYTQEVAGQEVVRWEGKELSRILLFINEEDPSHPYGHALVDPIADLIDIRKQMNEDIGKALHRYAWPKRIFQYDMSIADIKTAITEADVDEDIFLGNVSKDSLKIETLEVNPNTKFQSSLEMIYYQIAEGLHAPLLLYLKNATEASANVMMESVDRFVNGLQRYIKRRVERYLFKPQVGEPTPRLVWGLPKTGLEKVSLNELAALIPKLPQNQAQYLLKQFFPGIPEPEKEVTMQPYPFKPKPVEVPVEKIIEKLNDLQTGLNIIEQNYVERRISIVEAIRLADKTIGVYYKRVYPDEWREKRNDEFDRFVRRLLQLPKPSNVYQVKVE